MTLGKTTSNRSLPVDATTSKINATPEAVTPSRRASLQVQPSRSPTKQRRVATEPASPQKNLEAEASNEGAGGMEELLEITGPARKIDEQQNKGQAQVGWFGWMNKPIYTTTQPGVSLVASPIQAKDSVPAIMAEQADTTSNGPATGTKPSEPAQPEAVQSANSNKRTWLQMWTDDPANEEGQPARSRATLTQASTVSDPSKSLEIPKPHTASKSTSQASSIETSPPPALPGDPTKSSGWIFWARDRKPDATILSEEQPRRGEIAISDTPSQSRPKRASISLSKNEKPGGKVSQLTEISKRMASAKSGIADAIPHERPETSQPIQEEDLKQDPKAKRAESANASAMLKSPAVATPDRTPSPAPSAQTAENLLLPALDNTLSLPESPSILEQLARLLYFTKEPEPTHLSFVRDPPRIRNALAIGVHGYFPSTMVRTLLGQPTGTSIKFADMAAKSIRKWTRSRGYDCHVKTAALEGEGKIAERVELLWKLLLNWVDEIRTSDFVMVACHSQGVPVAIMLVSKLLQFGCINAARVGICAMAGVNMGPFIEYKSRWIGATAGELFEFSAPDSKVSTDYITALKVLMEAGVRLTFVGSIDDQLVSLESSLFATVTHPHIYRAVSIDGRIHAPNFISHLVGFVLKLRNLGVQDHGLIRELSSPLAGSLYSGEGHSRIYDDDAVYDLAVAFALETTKLTNMPLSRRTVSAINGNPYVLPFAIRGVLEEELVKTELQEEAQQLLREFDEWKPTTKTLKDVKFRLEGVRSKL